MAFNTVLHVRMSETIRKEFNLTAKDLGFRSGQDYLRYFMQSTVDGNYIQPTTNGVSPAARTLLGLLAMQIRGYESHNRPFTSPYQVIRHLVHQYQPRQMEKLLEQTFGRYTSSL